MFRRNWHPVQPSILFTQCLQNDFVQPIGRYEPMPNRLHVGCGEARRLMGEIPEEGPVARVMRWAAETSDDLLQVIHLRDWHDPEDPAQRPHLERFGRHCIRDTAGAGFAFPLPGKQAFTVDSLSLNDFHGTELASILSAFPGPRRAGIMGVWTEAKVTFLAYELCTRYPELELAVCSALTASSSRQRHFEALDQLERLLGVQVLASVGAFIDFLGGTAEDAPLFPVPERHPEVEVEGATLQGTDRTLLRYLFRDCRRVGVKALNGGFSGNMVLGTESVDLHGHRQVPHVVKIGPQEAMGQERTRFERIQQVLGNNAPQISDFADLEDRGAIKYRYASMGGAFSTTFQKVYTAGAAEDELRAILRTVFGEQLMRLYSAATLETCDLLQHYGFDPRWAPSVRRRVEALLPLTRDLDLPDLCRFYEAVLADLPGRPGERCYQAYVHGDLNGANIVLDGNRNVWLIDFFHTRRAHVLMDLVKLENDLLYIFTPIEDREELREAFAYTDALLQVADLGVPLPAGPEFRSPGLARAWATTGMLREFYPELIRSDRDPYQLWVGQLRYAAHTLSFDESSGLQKVWALYTAGRCAERITERLATSGKLRVHWLPDGGAQPGRFGITLLPGRRDRGRDLEEDLKTLAAEGVHRLLCLVPPDELELYGVGGLLGRARELGFAVHHLPIPDQKACAPEEMSRALAFLDEALTRGERVVAHCTAGLGRSGMLAACHLARRGNPPEEAIAQIRRWRSPRAVETVAQEQLVRAVLPDALGNLFGGLK